MTFAELVYMYSCYDVTQWTYAQDTEKVKVYGKTTKNGDEREMAG